MLTIKEKLPVFYEVLMAVLIQSPWFMVGVSESFTAFSVPQLQNNSSKIIATDDEISWIGSLGIFVTPIGCLFGGLIMEIWGRKIFLHTAYIPFIFSWYITGTAATVQLLYCGRILSGLSCGMIFCTPTYVSEIVTTKRRGPLLALQEPAYALGVVFCNVVMASTGWRYSAYVFNVSSALLFALSFFVVESPTWLVKNDRTKQAINYMSRLRVSVEQANKEIANVEAFCRRGKLTVKSQLKDLLNCWKQFCILLLMFILVTGTAAKILIVYTITFVNELRLPINSSAASILYSTVRAVGSCLPSLSAIYIGRKLSLGISSSGMAVAVTIILFYERTTPLDQRVTSFWLPLLSLNVFNLFFCLAAMTLPYTMVGELFPSNVAGLATGIYGSIGFILSGFVIKIYPSFLYRYGILVSLWIMTICSFLLILFAMYVLPETKGKPHEEIQRKFACGAGGTR